MGQEHLVQILKRFGSELDAKIRVNRLILFGSRAENRARAESDVDLLIVSEDFRGRRFRERVAGLRDLWPLDLGVDFLCYTPEEFEELKGQASVAREALMHGITILEREAKAA